MALQIGDGISIAGNLVNNADTDTYTVFLREGEVYDFWLGGDPNFGGAALSDAFLTLVGPGAGLPEQDDNDGAQDDPTGFNPPSFTDNPNAATITYRATVTGAYTLTVSEVLGGGNTGGDYALTFANRSFVDDIADHTFFVDNGGGTLPPATLDEGPANDDVGTQSAINVGDVFHSDINGNRPGFVDVDVIAVFLEGGDGAGGNQYTFELRGSETGDGTLPDPDLSLLDGAGNVVARNDDISSNVERNSRITPFDPDVGGTGTGWYFLRVQSHSAPTGTYELQAFSTGGAEDVPGDDASPFNVPLNSAVEGTIDIAADEDAYAINLVAGATYHFEATRISLNGAIELALVDSGGNVEDVDDDPTTAGFDFTVGAGDSGRYFVVVRGDTGTETGTYQVSATLVSAPPAPVHQITAVDDPAAVGSDLTDNITGSPGDDRISGHLGDDTVAGGLGNDTLNGGALSDSVAPTGDDSLSGNAGNDSINGEDGDDTIDGGDDNDTLAGGTGNNSLLGGLGLDSLSADIGDDTASGGAGNDTISDAGGNNLLDGGNDNDFIIVAGAGNDTITGGLGNDTINGSDGNNSIDGGDSGDQLLTGAGTDTVNGGEGDDLIFGGTSADQLNGGNGNDTFGDVGVGGAADSVTAGAGTDHLQSFIGWTLDTDEENLTLLGGTFINGNGNAGGNVIFGNNGANQLSGLGGNDTVNGGAGNDTLIGGFGKDLNTGGAGLDHIKFNSLGESGTTFATRDAINTFAHGDKIDLSAIDANSNVAGNQAFTFSSAQTLTGLSGLLIAQKVATNSFLVLADVNGDAHADFSLNVYTSPGFGNFAGFDFIL